MSESAGSGGPSVSFEEPTQVDRHPKAGLPTLASRHLTKAPHMPNPELSPDMAALAALSKPAAEKILRYLAANPDSFYGQIVEGIGVPQASVTRHLAELEANGVIAGDIPAEARRGRATRYRIQQESLRALFDRVQEQLASDAQG